MSKAAFERMMGETAEAMEAKWAKDDAVKALKEKASDARRLAGIIEERITQIEHITQDPRIRLSDQFNWTINDIENYLRNLNFAALARVHAKLVSTGQ